MINEKREERQIGERFTICKTEVIVIEFRGCRDCFLFDSEECTEFAHITGSCYYTNRSDNKTVCFMPVERAKQLGLIEE